MRRAKPEHRTRMAKPGRLEIAIEKSVREVMSRMEIARWRNKRPVVFDKSGAVLDSSKKHAQDIVTFTHGIASGQDYARHCTSSYEPAASTLGQSAH